MQQVIRRKVIVDSNGRIQIQAPDPREGTMAEVLIIVDAVKPRVTKKDRSELRESIATYAAAHAGTEVNLDPELEGAALEFLTNGQKGKSR